MKLYNFVVYLNHGAYPFGGPVLPFQQSYVVRHNGEMSAEWINYTASSLVLATRITVGQSFNVYRVVAFEVEEGKEYDENTETHACSIAATEHAYLFRAAFGFRIGQTFGHCAGITVCKNRVRGRVTKKLLRGAFFSSDLAHSRHNTEYFPRVSLRTDGQFVRYSFPFFRWVLEHLVGNESGFDVDRFGVVKELEPYVGRYMVGAAQNEAKKLRRAKYMSPHEMWMNKALYRAVVWIDNAAQSYRDVMERFDHTWGDGRIPQMQTVLREAAFAAAMWKPLALALGYELPDGYKYKNTIEVAGWLRDVPIPSGVTKLKARHEAIFRLVCKLYNAHQWLENTYPDGYPWGYYGKIPPDSQYSFEMYVQPRARLEYERFDQFSAAIFHTLSAINLLAQLIEVSNRVPYTKPPLQGPLYSFQPGRLRPPDGFVDMEVTPFLVCHPAPRDPFITTYSPAETTIVMTPTVPFTQTVPFVPPPEKAATPEDEIAGTCRDGLVSGLDRCQTQRGRIKMYGERFDSIFGTPAALKRINET